MIGARVLHYALRAIGYLGIIVSGIAMLVYATGLGGLVAGIGLRSALSVFAACLAISALGEILHILRSIHEKLSQSGG